MFQHRDHQARRVWMSVIGVVVCGMGAGLFRYIAFGVDPFQSLMVGVSALVPISYGLLYVLVNLALLLFSLVFDRSKIGLGTFINLFLLGYVVDYTYQFLLMLSPAPSMLVRCLLVPVALIVLSMSCSLYFVADLGVSTYDAIALVANQTWPRIPFRFYRIATDLLCVGLGTAMFLMGGNSTDQIGQVAGICTIVIAFFLGPLIDFFNARVSRPLLERGK